MRALFCIALVASVCASPAADVKLDFMSSGATAKIGYYMPIILEMSPQRPDGLTGGPSADGTVFGRILFGPRQYAYGLALNDVDEDNPVLYIDSNHDGKITEAEKVRWGGEKRVTPAGDAEPITTLTFSGSVQLEADGQKHTLNLYRFSRADEARRGTKVDRILYYRDYALTGKVKLGGQEFEVIVSDDNATGNLRLGETGGSHLSVLFDRNANGKFNDRGERYPADKPFNIGGTTYKVAALEGMTLRLAVSDEKVEEVVTPPYFGAGKKALPFQETAVDGKTIKFPEGFKGKVVVLDFWATWCGPCINELPHVLDAYGKFHGEGLEIVGISLDREGDKDKLVQFTKDRGMPWPQIYDGKYWEAKLAVAYGVQAIPRMFIVDGDTGVIIAEGNAVRGENLAKTIEKALRDKGLLKE